MQTYSVEYYDHTGHRYGIRSGKSAAHVMRAILRQCRSARIISISPVNN